MRFGFALSFRSTPVLELLEVRALLAAVTAQWSDLLVDSIGINTHFGNTSNPYNSSTLITKLDQLNVRHVRDNAHTAYGYGKLAQLAAFGIDSLLVADDTSVSAASHVAALQNDWAIGVEGLNEPDFNPRSYGGLTDNEDIASYLATMAYQHDLYDAIKADGVAASKRVLSPAFAHARWTPVLGAGGVANPWDLVAGHTYPNGAVPTRGLLDYEDLDALRKLSPTPGDNSSTWITESGYHNLTNRADGDWQQGISETAAGKYIPRMIAEYFNRGVPRTYLYELVDQDTNNATNQEKRWGLLHTDLSAKPAYTAIKNLITLLDDHTAAPFTPGSLDYTLSGNTAGVHQTLLQKGNGEFYLMLWQDTSSYNWQGTESDQSSSVNLTLNLNGTFSSAAAYRLDSTGAVGSWTNPRSISLSGNASIRDEVTVIKLVPTTPTTVPAPAISISANDATGQEWGTANRNAQFTVTRTGSTAASLVVNYSISGTATNATDYTNLTGSVTIDAGSSSAVINIVPTAEATIEGDETVVLTVSSNVNYSLADKFSDSAVILDDAPDLVVTNITWSPANPAVGDAVTFVATIQNVGTRATAAKADIRFRIGDDTTAALWSTDANKIQSGFAAGGTQLVPANGTWTGIGGNWPVRIMVDNKETTYKVESNGAVAESNERNNLLQKMMPVASQRQKTDFESGTLGGWTPAAGDTWGVSTVSGTKLIENTNSTQGSNGNRRHITKSLGTYSGSFAVEFDTSWRGGAVGSNGNYSLYTYADILDAAGNGYRVRVHQGTSGTTANASKLIELFRVNANVQESTSFAQGGGYNLPGWAVGGGTTLALRKLRLTYDRASHTFRAFADVNDDGVLEQVVSARDGTYTGFTQVRLGAGGFTSSETPGFDNILIDELL